MTLLFSSIFQPAVRSAEPPVDAVTNLVLSRAGDLPILLTAPHGGSSPIPGVTPRQSGTVTQDSRTLELATAVADRVEKLLGRRPYFVAARFHRKYLDVNRTPAEAMEGPAAWPVYDRYHGEIRRFVNDLRQRFPNGALFLDLHGQKTDKDTIHRGTQNGTTVKRLLTKHGVAAFIGTNSIFGRMRAAGFEVFPPNTAPGKPPEAKAFGGGFTVRTYGSHNSDGIDAIQMEFGSNLRMSEVRRAEAAEALAQAIAAFHRAYLEEARPANSPAPP